MLRRVTFSLQQSLAHRDVSDNETLLVVRRLIRGVLKDSLIKIRSTAKMRFLLNGEYDFTSASNVAVLTLHRGVSGIRVQNDQKEHSAPRLAAEKVTTLPTPTDTASPETVPSESAGCPDVSSCPASAEPSPSG
jgi:hypothetical protein